MPAPRTVTKPFHLAAVLAGAVGWFGWIGLALEADYFGLLLALSALGAVVSCGVGVARLARSADALRADTARAAEREHALSD